MIKMANTDTGTQAQNMIMIEHAEMLIQVRAAVLADVQQEIERRAAAHRAEMHRQIRKAHEAEHAQQAADAKHDSRVKILGHLTIIAMGGVIGYITSRLGAPDALAIAIGCVPAAIQEIFDFIKGL
jgi:hypothetical protein